MDITGIITKILPKQSGKSANGEWQKQEFVITTEDQYPKIVCFNTWGAKVDDLVNFSERDRVRVHFDVSSREYNEKYYTELRAWKIEREGSTDTSTVAPAHSQGTQASSQSASSQSSAPASTAPAAEDDLPF